jgi:hypothetical protein
VGIARRHSWQPSRRNRGAARSVAQQEAKQVEILLEKLLVVGQVGRLCLTNLIRKRSHRRVGGCGQNQVDRLGVKVPFHPADGRRGRRSGPGGTYRVNSRKAPRATTGVALKRRSQTRAEVHGRLCRCGALMSDRSESCDAGAHGDSRDVRCRESSMARVERRATPTPMPPRSINDRVVLNDRVLHDPLQQRSGGNVRGCDQ